MSTTFAVRIVQIQVAKHDTRFGIWHFLALRRSPTEMVFPNIWQPVTGSIEADETPQKTAFRELREETGLHVSELWVLPFVGSYFDSVRNVVNFVPCFGAIVGDDAVIELSDEHCAYAWVSLEEMRQRFVIPSHIEAGEHFYRSILRPLEQSEIPVFMRSYQH